jgi:hypothetical protein
MRKNAKGTLQPSTKAGAYGHNFVLSMEAALHSFEGDYAAFSSRWKQKRRSEF